MNEISFFSKNKYFDRFKTHSDIFLHFTDHEDDFRALKTEKYFSILKFTTKTKFNNFKSKFYISIKIY